MSWELYVNSRLRERGDDAARTVTYWDAAGALVPSTPEVPNPRPYTAAENAAADAAAAQQQEQAERDALLEEIGRIDAALAAEDARIQPCLDDGPQTINGSPAQYIKHNARAIKRVIKAARDLAAVVRDN